MKHKKDWYKDLVIYQIYPRSFKDGNNDGIGDLKGMIEKLDYLKELGINAVWMSPVYASPNVDNGYDISDYFAIMEEFGTMEDWDAFRDGAHERGIAIIMDLVLNHSSDKHKWFRESKKSRNNPYSDYYIWRDPAPDGGAPNCWMSVFGGSAWEYVPERGQYYLHFFAKEQPDLNWDNEMLKTEFEQIVQFWLDLGVDGFRLDAVKEFYSGADDKNIAVLTWFNDMVKSQKEDAYLVGEAWNDYSVYAKYYQSGMDSFFDFTFADKDGIIADTVKGINGASAYGKSLVNTQELYVSYSDTYIDAPFYTNHDMARSAGYYSGDYSEAQTKLGNAMNLLMSGSAFLYYGEELGMKGSGKDENKRAPMYWSTDADAMGMCNGPKDMDDIKMKYGSLEEQENDGNSIYNFVKQTIALRNEYPVIARGKVAFDEGISDDTVCVIRKTCDEGQLTLVFNTSEKAQTVDFRKSALGATEDRKYPLQIAGELLTGTEAAVLDEEQLTIPAYSVVILE